MSKISIYAQNQYIKQAILFSAWNEIENSHNFTTHQTAIYRGIKELLIKLDIREPKLGTLLEEIVKIDKWLMNTRDFKDKINYSSYAMTPSGRKEIDLLLKTKAEKLIDWVKSETPKVAKYFGDIVIKAAIK